MAFHIEDGKGTGVKARVDAESNLRTVAINHELQHHWSVEHGAVYQVIGDHTLGSSGTKTLLHLTNNDPNRFLALTYMRIQYPGGDGTIDAATYFQFGLDTTYTSDGTTVTPTNTNAISGNTATVTAYGNAPTVGGTFTEIDRWYADKEMQTFNKHGSIILGLNDTFEWRLVTDQTAGLAYVRCTFMMIDKSLV